MAGAFATLCTIYVIFSEICYYNFGNDLNEAIVMQEMPSDNIVIQIMKFLFSFNIFFSYPIGIYPANLIIDSTLFGRKENQPSKHLIKENISHTLVLALGILLAVFLYDKLDRILALTGTFIGCMIVLFIPSLCHY